MYQPHANSYFAAHMIAAAERHEADIERAERIRQFREYEGEANRSRRGVRRAPVRDAIGVALIRVGVLVRGGAAPDRLAQAS